MHGVCSRASVCGLMQRPEKVVLLLYYTRPRCLRQCLSLNLEIDWRSPSPSDPSVSASESSGVTGTPGHTWPHLATLGQNVCIGNTNPSPNSTASVLVSVLLSVCNIPASSGLGSHILFTSHHPLRFTVFRLCMRRIILQEFSPQFGISDRIVHISLSTVAFIHLHGTDSHITQAIPLVLIVLWKENQRLLLWDGRYSAHCVGLCCCSPYRSEWKSY